jgi:hypothetical protein
MGRRLVLRSVLLAWLAESCWGLLRLLLPLLVLLAAGVLFERCEELDGLLLDPAIFLESFGEPAGLVFEPAALPEHCQEMRLVSEKAESLVDI